MSPQQELCPPRRSPRGDTPLPESDRHGIAAEAHRHHHLGRIQFGSIRGLKAGDGDGMKHPLEIIHSRHHRRNGHQANTRSQESSLPERNPPPQEHHWDHGASGNDQTPNWRLLPHRHRKVERASRLEPERPDNQSRSKEQKQPQADGQGKRHGKRESSFSPRLDFWNHRKRPIEDKILIFRRLLTIENHLGGEPPRCLRYAHVSDIQL